LYSICHRTYTHGCLDSDQVSDLDRQRILHLTPASSAPGESPPPPPGVFFGRDELIERIIGFADNLTPVALVGAGGIGKTSIALTVLHADHIEQRFGHDRRFIRCDKFTASLTNFLGRLSKAIGAGAENPEDLTPLRPFLSSREMVIVLDNAESILDSEGKDAKEIYAAVEELSRFKNIWLCLTSRIATIPSNCETLDIPTLSMEAAHDTFYRIYKRDKRTDSVSSILEQLDFHPLSITLLATVAQHSGWKTDRLTKEWERRRTGVLHTKHKGSLADTIELSLASPTFRELGPDARELLNIVAFFPQGVDENNLDWLFPTILNRTNIFDTFCILSLTYRSNGFVTMLAPLRDHLCPGDPRSSSLLCTTKEHYLRRLSVDIYPTKPGYDEAKWITSEDVNVEHLLNVFTSVDANSDEVWSACHHFMDHLAWHKRRLVVLGPKIIRLPDNHPSKVKCLFRLARLSQEIGYYTESKRLFTHILELCEAQGDEFGVAEALWGTSHTNRMLNLSEEGIQQVREALEIYERLNNVSGQSRSLCRLAHLLYDARRFDSAERTALQAINRFSGQDEQLDVCDCHCALGHIYHSKGKRDKAIDHFKAALEVASSFNWDYQLCWIHYALADLFSDEGRFCDAHAHIERAKSHAANDAYCLGRMVELQALFWYRQGKFEEARSAASHAADVFERLEATEEEGRCKDLLQEIEQATERRV
jgi:tetratricopeptide (TPR) repeat protein